MVELQTTSSIRYHTDSNGLIAFHEPGLMNRKVWFGVSANGYEFPPDGFGMRGVTLETKQGGSARPKIKRINIAERLYRITGQGIYRDTVLLGRNPPIAEPLLNAEITGQDGHPERHLSRQAVLVLWRHGEIVLRAGELSMTGATTDLPAKLDPSVGFALKYFTGKDGFARSMSPIEGEDVVWLFGVVVIPDETGRERMLAYFQRRRGLGAVLENGFVVYNEEKDAFEKLKTVPLDPPIYPQLYSSRGQRDRTEHLYFNLPYPVLRVKADWKSYLDLSSYQSYTCLKLGTRYSKDQVELDRDSSGKLVWAWKKDTQPLKPKDQEELIAAGKMKREESPFRLQDADSGKPILLNNCSCFWNDYRKRYIMIASEEEGATKLGEVWYSEADQPEGPCVQARKIITHASKKDDAHDFYNPTHHPFFDQKGGQIIYLEGSYANTFSGNPHPTPYYEYNQIMYRLDLSDPRLKLPAGTALER
ncbi:MAG: hypothetical protein L0Z50_29190 [Verrucomicrobiales bacterium]|nr:hypothetical protein [Verrucomicrobiales bacterium]